MKALFLDNDIKKVLALKMLRPFLRSAPVGRWLSAPVGRWLSAPVGRWFPVRYGEVPEPALPGPRWLKVRVRSCGICGSDLHFIHLDMDPKCFPAAIPGLHRKYLGHELLAEVVETGAEATAFSVGDRVGLRIDWPSCFQLEIDPPCTQCRAGNYMLCENLGKKALAIEDNGGGFSPVMVMHRSQPYRIPDSLDDDRALLLEPMASAVHGVMKRLPEPRDKVLVFGGGTIGLLCVLAARTLSPEARITCRVRYPFQAEAARRLGADAVIAGEKDLHERIAAHTGAAHHKGYFGNEILLGGFDIIYDTVGSDASLGQSLRWVRGGGAVVLLGINFKPGRLDYTAIWNQEILLTGINCHADETGGENSFDLAARILAQTDRPVEELITHRFPMADFQKALAVFSDKAKTRAIKIVLDHP